MSNPEQLADATQNDHSSESVDFEKRFKDTQGAFTKSQQELKAAQAKISILEKLAKPKVELDEATKTELDDLKYSNPDKWRAKVNALETDAINKQNESLTLAQQQAFRESELASRAQLLADYNVANPNLVITDDVIKYDIPPRITKKLEDGKVSFEEFLNETKNYLSKPKKIGDGNTTLNQPNLSLQAGSDIPSKDTVGKDIVANYKNIIL